MRPRASMFGGRRDSSPAEGIASALAWAAGGNPWALGLILVSILAIGAGLLWYFNNAPEWNEAGFKILCREQLGEPVADVYERLGGERTFLEGCVTHECYALTLGGKEVEISCPDDRCFAMFQSAQAVCRFTVDPRLPVVQEVDTFWEGFVQRNGLPTE